MMIKKILGLFLLIVSISLYVKRDGEFYGNWDFSKKEWINKLTFLKSNRKYGNYEIILAFGYNETTGEYTPISNTIEYTVE